jgi:hypothetical protein
MSITGYGSNKKTKYMLPSSLRKFLVHYFKQLETLLVCNKSYCAEMITMFPPRAANPFWKEQPSWPLKSPILMPGCAVQKINRQLACMFYLCLK